MTTDQHVLEEILEALAMGRLPESEADRVEDHILVCEKCRLRFEQCEEFLRAARTAAARIRAREAVPARPTFASRIFTVVPSRPFWAVGGVLAFAALTVFSLGRQPAGAVTYRELSLTATRGIDEVSSVSSGALLRLKLDLRDLPSLSAIRVLVVDAQGLPVFDVLVPTGQATTPGIEITKRLPPGTYWVRVLEPAGGGKLMREYPLQLD